MPTDKSIAARRAGQAIVEFLAALIVVMVLLAGLLQIARLARAHTATISAARRAAGLAALGAAEPASAAPQVISDWLPGSDQRRYTRDDLAVVVSNAAVLPALLASRARLEALPGAPANRLAAMAAGGGGDYALVQGAAAAAIETLPVIRRLVYPRPEIDVQSDCWLVWTEGLY